MSNLKQIHKAVKQKLDKRGEEGAALASVVMLAAFVFIMIFSVAATSMVATDLTATSKHQVSAVMAAESGIDAAVYEATTGNCEATGTSADGQYSFEVFRSASNTDPMSVTAPSVEPGCPQNGDRYILVRSTGEVNGSLKEVVASYRWTIRGAGSGDGAIMSGGGNLNISTLTVTQDNADIILVKGDFNCNSNSNISGDVVVFDGTTHITNNCRIAGNLFASGNLSFTSAAGVDGDVYVLGDFSITNPTHIGGNVFVKGNMQLSAGTVIDGNLTVEGTGTTNIGQGTIGGNVHTAGRIRIENARITGNITGSNTAQATIFPTAIIGGRVTLASSSIDTWGTIQAAGGVELNQPVAAPSWEVPKELLDGTWVWKDYNYDELDWVQAGYNVEKRTSCDFQNSAVTRGAINSLTRPTLVDMRGCSIRAYGVTFNLQTDVTFLVDRISNFQAVSVNSTGGPRTFNIVTPDLVSDNQPTCSPGQQGYSLYNFRMANEVTGMIYTPCRVEIGGAPSRINGQVYGGEVGSAGGSSTTLNYFPQVPPGFPIETVLGPADFNEEADHRTMPLLVSRSES